VEAAAGRPKVLTSIDVPKAAAEDCPASRTSLQPYGKQDDMACRISVRAAMYEPHLQRMYDDAHLRAADVAQLEQIAAGYESRERFLTELTLDPPMRRVAGAGEYPRRRLHDLVHDPFGEGQEWRIVRILTWLTAVFRLTWHPYRRRD